MRSTVQVSLLLLGNRVRKVISVSLRNFEIAILVKVNRQKYTLVSFAVVTLSIRLDDVASMKKNVRCSSE